MEFPRGPASAAPVVAGSMTMSDSSRRSAVTTNCAAVAS
jgi:hypothetical protein